MFSTAAKRVRRPLLNITPKYGSHSQSTIWTVLLAETFKNAVFPKYVQKVLRFPVLLPLFTCDPVWNKNIWSLSHAPDVCSGFIL